ncbi:MAG: hypothetical protein JO305_00780 [Alphaproteobacteria bacterium]|nr:hypothetical protein [Alphaproteobacteria bacterium]
MAPAIAATATSCQHAGMVVAVDMRVVELLLARLCHELIGPVAAVGNGVELITEDEAAFAREAVALVAESARKASGRLQFYRFAYGFGFGKGLTGPPPHELVSEFLAGGRVTCDYAKPVQALPLEWQKLACNLVAIGAEALPRGGHLSLSAGAAGPQIEGEGENAGASAELSAALSLAAPIDALTSRTIGGFYAGLVAQALERRIAVAPPGPGRFRIEVRPAV